MKSRKQTSTNYRNEQYLYERCAMNRGIDIINGRWKGQLMLCVRDGINRFSEMKDEIEGITDGMLGKQLGALEEDHLIERKVYADVPPRVEYQLTDFGKELCEILQSLCDWTKALEESIDG